MVPSFNRTNIQVERKITSRSNINKITILGIGITLLWRSGDMLDNDKAEKGNYREIFPEEIKFELIPV